MGYQYKADKERTEANFFKGVENRWIRRNFKDGAILFKNTSPPMKTEILIAKLLNNGRWNVDSNPIRVFKEQSFKTKLEALKYARKEMKKHPRG